MVSCSIVSPSYFFSKEDLKNSRNNLSKIGFDNIRDFISFRPFFKIWAGSPSERKNLFYEAWRSDSNAVICSQGGSGTIHFSPSIEKRDLKKQKILLGYSDFTFLLNYFNKYMKIITFHGPNASKKLDKKSISALRDALQMKNYGIIFNEKQILINSNKNFLKSKIIGGNLERFVESLIYLDLNLKNKILFFEEIGLKEEKIYNLLSSLKNYPKFKPKAILFGDLGVKNKKLMKDMIKYLFPDTPVITDLPFGHKLPNITIPIGANCEIDFKKKKIKFLFPKSAKKYSIDLNKN